MKYHIYLFLIVYGISFGQNTNSKKSEDLKIKANFRLQGYYPINFGNNALAEVHKPKIGSSYQLYLLDFNKFKAGIGADFCKYEITNTMFTGNFNESKYTSSYIIISYIANLTKKLLFVPTIGYGSSSLELNSRSSRFGKQGGKEFRIGTSFDYKISNAIYISNSVNYINNKFSIATSKEYVDFFSKANQIQCNFGIRFGN